MATLASTPDPSRAARVRLGRTRRHGSAGHAPHRCTARGAWHSREGSGAQGDCSAKLRSTDSTPTKTGESTRARARARLTREQRAPGHAHCSAQRTAQKGVQRHLYLVESAGGRSYASHSGDSKNTPAFVIAIFSFFVKHCLALPTVARTPREPAAASPLSTGLCNQRGQHGSTGQQAQRPAGRPAARRPAGAAAAQGRPRWVGGLAGIPTGLASFIELNSALPARARPNSPAPSSPMLVHAALPFVAAD